MLKTIRQHFYILEKGSHICLCFFKRFFQTFIQAVLLMPIFEQRSSLFCFMTNDYEVTVKCRWRSGGAVSSVDGSWRSYGGSSGGKDPENLGLFTSGGHIK